MTKTTTVGIVSAMTSISAIEREIMMVRDTEMEVITPAPLQPETFTITRRGITINDHPELADIELPSWFAHKQNKPNKGLRLGSYNSKNSKR
jgi:hypothetical protein